MLSLKKSEVFIGKFYFYELGKNNEVQKLIRNELHIRLVYIGFI